MPKGREYFEEFDDELEEETVDFSEEGCLYLDDFSDDDETEELNFSDY